jgi:hypothetical protein
VPLAAQERAPPERTSIVDQLGLDRLRLSGVGATLGIARPAQVVGTQMFGLHADYGEVRRQWRVVFGASYWGSRYTDRAVRRFADSLRAIVRDPSGDAQVELGKISVSVVALTADARWSPRRLVLGWRPYAGGSVGGYALNVEGRGVSGTFLETALDNISIGTAVVGGGDAFLAPNLSVGLHGRYDFLGGARYASARGGITYVFRAREGR